VELGEEETFAVVAASAPGGAGVGGIGDRDRDVDRELEPDGGSTTGTMLCIFLERRRDALVRDPPWKFVRPWRPGLSSPSDAPEFEAATGFGSGVCLHECGLEDAVDTDQKM
jgi:hypothetical protein